MSAEYHDELMNEIDAKANEIIDKLPAFAGKFFEHVTNTGMSERTKRQYAYDLQKFFHFIENSAGLRNVDIQFCNASEVLDQLTIDDINEFVNCCLRKHQTVDKRGQTHTSSYSPSTRARIMSCIRSFYRYYFKIGEIQSNLADLIDVPAIPSKQIVALDEDKCQRLLAAVQDTSGMNNNQLLRHEKTMQRDLAIMMLFFGTGMRVSELVGIDIGDIDFESRAIIITRKGGDEDEVFFSPAVQDVLEDYIDNCRDALATSEADTEALFISMHHKRMAVRSVQDMISKYAAKAGISAKVTPHALRRSYGTHLYEETGDIYLTAAALNHKSVQTTSQHYAKMSREQKKKASEHDIFQKPEK